MISQSIAADSSLDIEERVATRRIAEILGKTIFLALLSLLLLTAIPYGTNEALWKALFLCLIFATGILWVVEGFLSGSWTTGGHSILLPPLALAAFSLCQTIPITSQFESVGGIEPRVWYALSADPYETRFFVLQLLGLTLATALLFRYLSEKRARTLIHLIIGLAVAWALYGILRQTTQHGVGFGLPLIKPGQGYGQFVNKNHFAFFMEMAFGLTLGMIVAGGVKREQALIYFASLLPVWTALVLCNSRGGLVAMLAQVISVVLLFTAVIPHSGSNRSTPGIKARPPGANAGAVALRVISSLPVRAALLLVLIGAIVFGTLWLGGDRLVSSLEATRTEFDSPTVTNEGVRRKDIWRATWKMIADHPFAGVGMGGYWAAIPTYHDASGTMTPQQAHNDYLELMASGGIVGLAIGVWFVVAVFRRTSANLKTGSRFRRAACFGAAIGLIGVAVHSFVDFGLHLTANALVFAALIVIATGCLKEEGKSRRTSVAGNHGQ